MKCEKTTFLRTRSETEDKAHAVLDPSELRSCQDPNPFEESPLVDRRHLRDVDDRALRQARVAAAARDVSRRGSEFGVRRDRGHHHGVDRRFVEVVDLQNEKEKIGDV